MTAPWMPPLPEPHGNPFAAIMISACREYGLACYQQAIEDAAKVCAEEAKKWKYPKYRYAAAAATHCEALIRRLKDTP